MPAEIGYSLRRGRGGCLACVWGVQTHSGPPVFLVAFHKDLARMNGTPQPNQALGIEPESLDHKSQPLTIGPLLTPGRCMILYLATGRRFMVHLRVFCGMMYRTIPTILLKYARQ